LPFLTVDYVTYMFGSSRFRIRGELSRFSEVKTKDDPNTSNSGYQSTKTDMFIGTLVGI